MLSESREYAEQAEFARTFVAGLDRSSIGNLAVDASVLSMVMSVCLMSRKQADDDWHVLDAEAERLCDISGLPLSAVESEVMLWYGTDGIRLQIGSISPRHERRLAQLQLAARSPHFFLPYFEAGIWDADMVAAFTSSGIDVEMALVLLAEGRAS